MIDLQVKHHFPGRVRFKVPALKQHSDIGNWIKTSLLAIQGIRDVRVNEEAYSITIEYDPQIIKASNVETRLLQLDFDTAEQEETEHEYTRGDIAMNVIGTIAAALLPNKWAAMSTATLIAPTLFEGI